MTFRRDTSSVPLASENMSVDACRGLQELNIGHLGEIEPSCILMYVLCTELLPDAAG